MSDINWLLVVGVTISNTVWAVIGLVAGYALCMYHYRIEP